MVILQKNCRGTVSAMHEGQSGERKKIVAPLSMTARGCEKTHLDGSHCNFGKKVLYLFCPKSSQTEPLTGNCLKDDDLLPWRNAF